MPRRPGGRRLIALWLALAYLSLCCIGHAYRLVRHKRYVPASEAPTQRVVQLRSATLPGKLGWVASHYWFAVFDPQIGRWERWEVWQNPNAGGVAWGHVHKNMLHPDAGVGGGPCHVVCQWGGAEAARLEDVLHRAPEYPQREIYRAWPGPNSNSFATWVLQEAQVSADLGPKAIGKDYLGRAGVALSTTRTGVLVESTPIGLKIGLKDGIELHVLGITIGVDLWWPAIKTPFGRFGFPE